MKIQKKDYINQDRLKKDHINQDQTHLGLMGPIGPCFFMSGI